MVLNNVFQLKHIQLSKHMHYCIQKIYHVYYITQWNLIILRKFSHMSLTSPNEKWMRVADILRRFCLFLLWRGEFCFDVVGNFETKNITPNCNALAKSIISYLWVPYFTFVFSWQCKTILFINKKALRDVIRKSLNHGLATPFLSYRVTLARRGILSEMSSSYKHGPLRQWSDS